MLAELPSRQDITEGLYELIMANPESRAFFPDQATLARVKRLQNAYFLHLFSGTYDLNYVRDRLRVGAAQLSANNPIAGLRQLSGLLSAESLARPGGNVTGFVSFEYSMAGKWLETLKEALRKAETLGKQSGGISA